jgi:parvulin-like peptidyl-prolyl isomerase
MPCDTSYIIYRTDCPMKNSASIFLPTLLILIVFVNWANPACSAPIYQAPNKKPTPDPYFHPKNAPSGSIDTPQFPASNSVRSFAGEAFADSTPRYPLPQQSPATNPSPATNGVTPAGLWDTPRTPVNRTPGSPPEKSSEIQNTERTDRDAEMFENNFSLVPQQSIIRNKFLSPVPSPELATETQDATPAGTKPVPTFSPSQLDSSNEFGGEFSGDLTNLKRPAVPQNTTQPSNTKSDEMKAASTGKSTEQLPFQSPNPSTVVTDTRPIPTSTKPKIETPQVKAFEPSQLLAMVGNEPIFVGDLMFETNQLIEKFMPTAPPEIKASEGKKMISRLLPKFVDSKLLYMGTLRMLPEGADVSKILEQASKEFDENAMQKMMDSAGLKTASEFDAQLRAQGSSLRKMRLTWSQDQLTKYFLGQQLNVDNEVTHQAMLDDYRQRLTEYATPARAKWEQVMVRFDRTSSRDEAEKQLVEMGNAIVYGANFAAVAKKSSHGFRAASGGRHDWTSRGALVLKELDDAIFSLPIGELSDKIETQDGFHIVRVIERTEASHKPFLEAQVEIKERMLEEKRTDAFKKHLEKLRDEIPVEYFINDLPNPTVATAPGGKIR